MASDEEGDTQLGSQGLTDVQEAEEVEQVQEVPEVQDLQAEDDNEEEDRSLENTVLGGRYHVGEYIGGGVFGSVWKAFDPLENQTVAIKVIKQDEDYEGVQPSVIREVSLLKGFHHENIVRLLDLILPEDRDEYQLVFEYLDMDLWRVLQQVRLSGTTLPMPFLVKYTRDLLEGIHACHVRMIFHRDLKPHNLLIGVRGLKIADFGLARMLSLSQTRAYTCEVVTLWYRAPELLLGAPRYGSEVDLWSAGCIIAEMAVTKPLFSGSSEIATIFKVFQMLGTPHEDTYPGIASLEHWKPTFPRWRGQSVEPILAKRPEMGDDGRSLLGGLLQVYPPARLTARRAKLHPFCQMRRPEVDPMPHGGAGDGPSGVMDLSAVAAA